MTRGRAIHCLSLLVPLLACSSGVSPVPPQAVSEPAARAPVPEPLCKVLQPQFDRLVQRFSLGGRLDCEELPGVLTLGQFGLGRSLDRSLLACVDDNAVLAKEIQSEPAAVAGVEYESEASTNASGVLGLGRVAPWLPDVRAANHAGQRLRLKLAIVDASWDTIPALTKVFEGQNHAHECMPALCEDDAQVVYKVLRGKVQVELSTSQAKGFEGAVELLGGAAGFAVDDKSRKSNSVTLGSNERLVLGVIAKPAKAELADAKHCDGCGARGQTCCAAAPSCDEDLSCIEGHCRPRGYPGAACEAGHCKSGAVCVRGTCLAGCGAAGLTCCASDSCSDGLECHWGQRARREVSMFDQNIEHGGGLFGTDVDLDFGSGSCGPGRLRSRFTTLKVAGDSSHCDKAQWISPTDASDCRIRVHMHISPLSRIRCQVQVFATEVDPQVPAPQALCR